MSEWIPVSERLPKHLEEVNVTWVNHAPEFYYSHIKDHPFTSTAVYDKARNRWWWFSSRCADYLGEYGWSIGDEVDDAIEILAWMPLPEPYKAEQRKEE